MQMDLSAAMYSANSRTTWMASNDMDAQGQRKTISSRSSHETVEKTTDRVNCVHRKAAEMQRECL